MTPRRSAPPPPALSVTWTIALAALVAAVPIVLGLVAAAGGAVAFASFSSAGSAGDLSSVAMERFDRWLHGDLQVRLEDLGSASALVPSPTAGGPGSASGHAPSAALAPRALAAESARLL